MINSICLDRRHDRLAKAIERARTLVNVGGCVGTAGVLSNLSRDLDSVSQIEEARARSAGYDEIEGRLVRAGAEVWRE